MPNRQRNTRANSARSPARPSVIEVIHRAAGSKISSVAVAGLPAALADPGLG
jgi:hypothetical protein